MPVREILLRERDVRLGDHRVPVVERGVGQQLVGRAGERGTDVAAPVRSGTEEEPVRDGEAEVGGGLPALPVGQQIGGGRYRYQRLSTVDILAPGTAGEEVRYGVTRRGRDPQRDDRQQRHHEPGQPDPPVPLRCLQREVERERQ